MFITGMDPFLGSVFTFTTLLMQPSAVKVFNYLLTLWREVFDLLPQCFVIGFVSTFITGGLTGIVLGDSLDINVHDTYCCWSFSYCNRYRQYMECSLVYIIGSLKCMVK